VGTDTDCVLSTHTDGVLNTGTHGVLSRTGTDGVLSTGTDGVLSRTGTDGVLSTGTDGVLSTGTDGVLSTGTDVGPRWPRSSSCVQRIRHITRTKPEVGGTVQTIITHATSPYLADAAVCHTRFLSL